MRHEIIKAYDSRVSPSGAANFYSAQQLNARIAAGGQLAVQVVVDAVTVAVIVTVNLQGSGDGQTWGDVATIIGGTRADANKTNVLKGTFAGQMPCFARLQITLSAATECNIKAYVCTRSDTKVTANVQCLCDFDEMIALSSGTSVTVRTDARWTDLVGSFDSYMVQGVADTVSGGINTYTVEMEHSNDGRNWIPKGSLLINRTGMTANNTYVDSNGEAGAAPIMAFVRFKITASGSVAGQFHLRLTVCAAA